MNAWIPVDIKADAVESIGPNLVLEIGRQFGATAGGAKYMLIAVGLDVTTVGTQFDLKLQTRAKASAAWQDAKVLAVTGTGVQEALIKWVLEVENDLLAPLCRVVVDTGGGSLGSLEYCRVIQEQ